MEDFNSAAAMNNSVSLDSLAKTISIFLVLALTMSLFPKALGDDDDIGNGFEFDVLNDGEGETSATAKECTGRWTREEHQAFIKGLELYGKGWKKIAGLIKTRTVVQIRTHAQKYFLKLSKARQNGEITGFADGRPYSARKKLRRRLSDRPLSVTPLLQPFLALASNAPTPTSSSSSTDPNAAPLAHDDASIDPNASNGSAPSAPTAINVHNSIYNFLSPPLVAEDLSRQLRVVSTNDLAALISTSASSAMGNSVSCPNLAGIAKDEETEPSPPAPVADANSTEDSPPPVDATTEHAGAGNSQAQNGREEALRLLQSIIPPAWYQKGEHIVSLLKEAEELDWEADAATSSSSVTTPRVIRPRDGDPMMMLEGGPAVRRRRTDLTSPTEDDSHQFSLPYQQSQDTFSQVQGVGIDRAPSPSEQMELEDLLDPVYLSLLTDDCVTTMSHMHMQTPALESDLRPIDDGSSSLSSSDRSNTHLLPQSEAGQEREGQEEAVAALPPPSRTEPTAT
eukprot:gene10357-11467_t